MRQAPTRSCATAQDDMVDSSAQIFTVANRPESGIIVRCLYPENPLILKILIGYAELRFRQKRANATRRCLTLPVWAMAILNRFAAVNSLILKIPKSCKS